MRKFLATAALLAGLMAPAAGSTAATTTWPDLPCQNQGIDMCDIQYEEDLGMCELAQPSQQQGCRAEAAWRWAGCKAC